MDGIVSTLQDWTYKCKYFQEMCGTALFMMFGAFAGDGDAFKVGAIYLCFYVLWRNLFDGARASFNPALTMADVMSNHLSIGEAIMMWISQGIGAFVGYVIAGSIGYTISDHLEVENFNFYNVVVSEIVGSALLVWLWLDIDSKDRGSKWRESFYGLAPAFMYFLSMSIMAGGCLNPAKYEAKWFANDVLNPGEREVETSSVDDDGAVSTVKTTEAISSWEVLFAKDSWTNALSAHNITFYFAPIVSAFMTSLVYAWVNKA